jgi:hypothetical protein
MAEDDLIEEYLEGHLQGAERENFLREFLSIPHQRNKLRIAKSLRRFARDEANLDTVPIQPVRLSEEVDTEPIEFRGISEAEIDTVPIERDAFVKRQVLPFYRNPFVYAPAAVLALVAITVGVVWYVQYRGDLARDSLRQEVERELAQLNRTGEPNPSPDKISTLIVLPFSPRSVVASSSSNLRTQILELWLIPSPAQSERYEALLQKIGSEDQYRIPNLRLQERASQDKAVRLRIPARLLTPGTYTVQLSALSPEGTVSAATEYTFEIQ